MRFWCGGMDDEEKFGFGRVRYRVLEGKEGVREAYDCMAGAYDYSRYLYWTRKMEVCVLLACLMVVCLGIFRGGLGLGIRCLLGLRIWLCFGF